MVIEFFASLKWDIVITLLLSLILEISLVIKRSKKNKKLKNKKDIFKWEDFTFSIVTAATFFGGVSAIYFAGTGKLLFEQSLIISQEYIILFAGLVLMAFAIKTYWDIWKKIKR